MPNVQGFKLPDIKQQYFPLKGGLDLLTPQIEMSPGVCFDALNYEPEIAGGYSRIWGYERSDGRQSPTSAPYWIMVVTVVGAIVVGNVITGLTSSAVAKVLAVESGKLILGRVVGTFATIENIQIGGMTVAISVSGAGLNGESDPSNDADYALLAANDLRADILQVPGQGAIRGVAVYNDGVYAFRDAVGGATGAMYKQTPGGWTLIAFKKEIRFNTGTGQINIGDTITGGTSAAAGTVVAVLLQSGTWGGTGVGSLVYTATAGSLISGEAIKVGGVSKATSISAGATITRNPGGHVEYLNGNFTGSTATVKMYGVDGVNCAFEFDANGIYIPIHTGMASDLPSHMTIWRQYLWLSFLGSVQLSAIGNPYAWTAVLGAAEIATGDYVTGFLPQGASSTGSSLAVFTKGRTHTIYGNTTASFQMTESIFDVGYSAYTMQPVSNNTYGLTSRGIQSLITTLTYGDFDYASVSHLIQPLMTLKLGLETASTSIRSKNQYRVFFNDGSVLVVGLTGDKVSGILNLDYGRVVRCITTATLSNGTEVTYFGSDDGYVYLDNTGTSFDGAAIESWIRPTFNHSKSPRIRKRYRRAVFEVKAYGYSKVNIAYDLGYATPAIMQPIGTSNNQISAGGYWDQFVWEQFTWDTKVFSDISMTLSGTEKNISFLFYSNRAQDSKHTVQGITLMYSEGRAER